MFIFRQVAAVVVILYSTVLCVDESWSNRLIHCDFLTYSRDCLINTHTPLPKSTIEYLTHNTSSKRYWCCLQFWLHKLSANIHNGVDGAGSDGAADRATDTTNRKVHNVHDHLLTIDKYGLYSRPVLLQLFGIQDPALGSAQRNRIEIKYEHVPQPAVRTCHDPLSGAHRLAQAREAGGRKLVLLMNSPHRHLEQETPNLASSLSVDMPVQVIRNMKYVAHLTQLLKDPQLIRLFSGSSAAVGLVAQRQQADENAAQSSLQQDMTSQSSSAGAARRSRVKNRSRAGKSQAQSDRKDQTRNSIDKLRLLPVGVRPEFMRMFAAYRNSPQQQSENSAERSFNSTTLNMPSASLNLPALAAGPRPHEQQGQQDPTATIPGARNDPVLYSSARKQILTCYVIQVPPAPNAKSETQTKSALKSVSTHSRSTAAESNDPSVSPKANTVADDERSSAKITAASGCSLREVRHCQHMVPGLDDASLINCRLVPDTAALGVDAGDVGLGIGARSGGSSGNGAHSSTSTSSRELRIDAQVDTTAWQPPLTDQYFSDLVSSQFLAVVFAPSINNSSTSATSTAYDTREYSTYPCGFDSFGSASYRGVGQSSQSNLLSGKVAGAGAGAGAAGVRVKEDKGKGKGNGRQGTATTEVNAADDPTCLRCGLASPHAAWMMEAMAAGAVPIVQEACARPSLFHLRGLDVATARDWSRVRDIKGDIVLQRDLLLLPMMIVSSGRTRSTTSDIAAIYHALLQPDRSLSDSSNQAMRGIVVCEGGSSNEVGSGDGGGGGDGGGCSNLKSNDQNRSTASAFEWPVGNYTTQMLEYIYSFVYPEVPEPPATTSSSSNPASSFRSITATPISNAQPDTFYSTTTPGISTIPGIHTIGDRKAVTFTISPLLVSHWVYQVAPWESLDAHISRGISKHTTFMSVYLPRILEDLKSMQRLYHHQQQTQRHAKQGIGDVDDKAGGYRILRNMLNENNAAAALEAATAAAAATKMQPQVKSLRAPTTATTTATHTAGEKKLVRFSTVVDAFRAACLPGSWANAQPRSSGTGPESPLKLTVNSIREIMSNRLVSVGEKTAAAAEVTTGNMSVTLQHSATSSIYSPKQSSQSESEHGTSQVYPAPLVEIVIPRCCETTTGDLAWVDQLLRTGTHFFPTNYTRPDPASSSVAAPLLGVSIYYKCPWCLPSKYADEWMEQLRDVLFDQPVDGGGGHGHGGGVGGDSGAQIRERPQAVNADNSSSSEHRQRYAVQEKAHLRLLLRHHRGVRRLDSFTSEILLSSMPSSFQTSSSSPSEENAPYIDDKVAHTPDGSIQLREIPSFDLYFNGKEATAYLQHIVRRFYSLAPHTIFLHSQPAHHLEFERFTRTVRSLLLCPPLPQADQLSVLKQQTYKGLDIDFLSLNYRWFEGWWAHQPERCVMDMLELLFSNSSEFGDPLRAAISGTARALSPSPNNPQSRLDAFRAIPMAGGVAAQFVTSQHAIQMRPQHWWQRLLDLNVGKVHLPACDTAQFFSSDGSAGMDGVHSAASDTMAASGVPPEWVGKALRRYQKGTEVASGMERIWHNFFRDTSASSSASLSSSSSSSSTASGATSSAGHVKGETMQGVHLSASGSVGVGRNAQRSSGANKGRAYNMHHPLYCPDVPHQVWMPQYITSATAPVAPSSSGVDLAHSALSSQRQKQQLQTERHKNQKQRQQHKISSRSRSTS